MKRLITTMSLLLAVISISATNTIIFYHNNYGMISEDIKIPLEKGSNEFRYKAFPSSMEYDTVMLIPKSEAAITVISQHFKKPVGAGGAPAPTKKTQLLNRYLNGYIGKEIELALTDGSIERGVLLYRDDSTIVLQGKKEKKDLVFNQTMIRNFIMPTSDYDLNQKLGSSPFLEWKISANKKDEYDASLVYLCTGFNWQGAYRGVWDEETLEIDISAKIGNTTNKNLKDFRVLLIAGEPQKMTQDRRQSRRYERAMMSISSISHSDSAPEFTAETFDEYHVFSYPEKVSLVESETINLKLYDRKTIKPSVHYEYRTGTNYVTTRLVTKNEKANKLGIALPQGKIQVYRKDNQENTLTFVGEDYVEQVPVGEEWVITPGKAFDVVGKTTVLDTRSPSQYTTEMDMKVVIKNQGIKDRAIEVHHRLSGKWEVKDESHQYEKRDANTIVFKKTLKPKEEFLLTWTEYFYRQW